MQDMMATAATWFETQRRAHLSINADYYKSGSSTAVPCVVTVVTGRWDVMDAAGQMARIQTRDIFVAVSDYSDQPNRGDRIVTSDGEAYEVIVPPGRQQCWSWADRAEKLRRIHCLRIEDYRVSSTVFASGVFDSGVYAA
jgi:hypothetical protein